MPDRTFLDWPFFEPRHRDLAAQADDWAARTVPALVDHHDVDGSCRRLVAALGEAGFLRFAAPETGCSTCGRSASCARPSPATTASPISPSPCRASAPGADAVRHAGPARGGAARVRAGRRIAAFALTEPEAGSDVAQIALAVQPAGDGMVRLDGEKTWISNGGIADTYVVFARSGEAPGARGLSAYLVPADTPGLRIAERLDTIAPHPLARLHFENCRVPAQNRIGEAGAGFKVAMATLDVFRSTVGAAALGFARRALDASLARAQNRTLFGAPLAAMQLTQTSLAEMATAIDTAALHVYRAAWTRDSGAPRITREAAMAKMVATEAAQEVIDRAVQLHGGEGVRSGSVPETLYREIRALRIYEGATEVQKLVIARQILA